MDIFSRQLLCPNVHAEIGNSYIGPWVDFVHEIEQKYFNQTIGFLRYVLVNNERNKITQLVVAIVWYLEQIYDRNTNPSKRPLGFFSNVHHPDLLSRIVMPSRSLQKFVDRVMGKYLKIASDPVLQACFKEPKTNAPIEVIMGPYLVAMHMDRLTLAELSYAIAGMRRCVREKLPNNVSTMRNATGL
jgi:hypothetical protein